MSCDEGRYPPKDFVFNQPIDPEERKFGDVVRGVVKRAIYSERRSLGLFVLVECLIQHALGSPFPLEVCVLKS